MPGSRWLLMAAVVLLGQFGCSAARDTQIRRALDRIPDSNGPASSSGGAEQASFEPVIGRESPRPISAGTSPAGQSGSPPETADHGATTSRPSPGRMPTETEAPPVGTAAAPSSGGQQKEPEPSGGPDRSASALEAYAQFVQQYSPATPSPTLSASESPTASAADTPASSASRKTPAGTVTPLASPSAAPLAEAQLVSATAVAKTDQAPPASTPRDKPALPSPAPVADVSDDPIAPPETTATPTAAIREPLASPPPLVPIDDWRGQLDAAITAIETELLSEPSDMTAEQRAALETNLRFLYLANARYDEAARRVTQLSATEQEFLTQLMYGLGVYFDSNAVPITDRRAKQALVHLGMALQQLGTLASLRVNCFTLSDNVQGFGRYHEYDRPFRFRPGQNVLLYVELENLAAEKLKDGSGYRTSLKGILEILRSDGTKLLDTDLPEDTSVCRNHRRDYYIAYEYWLPKDLTPGRYQFRLVMADEIRRQLESGIRHTDAVLDFEVLP